MASPLMPQTQGTPRLEGGDATKEVWATPITRIGTAGLQLNKSLDLIGVDELIKMLNLYHTGDGRLTTRAGMTTLQATGGTKVHSLGRLNDPSTGNFARFAGVDGNLYRDGSLIDGGYSGSPLQLLPIRPFIGAGTWMVAADKNKMSISPLAVGGPTLPLGIVAPSVAAVTAPQSFLTAEICSFDATTSTQATNWTSNPGQDRSSPPIPSTAGGVNDVLNSPQGQGCSFITSNGGGIKTGYSDFYCCPFAGLVDATKLNGGVATATDDDIIHVWIQLPGTSSAHLEEFRIYLVCNAGFDPTSLPGSGIGNNTDAFVKSFAPADLSSFINQQASAQTTAATVASAEARRQFLLQQTADQTDLVTGGEVAAIKYPYDSTFVEPPAVMPGTTWGQLGIIGLPIRRSEFQRIGNTSGVGWNTLSGIVVFIQTSDTSIIQVNLDDLYITGGYGPDTADAADQPYDYRYTYFDPRTGFESNPSPIQPVTSWLNLLRQAANLTPTPHPDANLLERWYRRGGTLPTDWNFLGTSTAHGQLFQDTFSDLTITGAGTLAINHDQPITTVNANGGTVLAQPLPAVWGPTDNGYVFGCGDPFRPGFLYWCIPGNVGAWPALNTVEVCSSSEQLMNGVVWGGQTYAFSRERLYVVYPNFDGAGNVHANSTACPHGLMARQGLAATPYGIAFIARDGIRITSGSGSTVSSPHLWKLFHGQAITTPGLGTLYNPVDMTAVDAMRLVYHDDELWFFYQDTTGAGQCLIFRFAQQFWRSYVFGRGVTTAFSDTGAQTSLILGGTTTGKLYTHSGVNDDGVAIPWQAHTGSWDASAPRQEKQFGDVVLDADLAGTTLTLKTYLNTEQTALPTQTVVGAVGRNRYSFDAFGSTPAKARTLAFDLSGTAGASPVILEFIGASFLVQPDVIMQRATNWDDLESPTEKYLYGVQIEADTGGGAVPVVVEYSLNGVITTVPGFTIQTTGRQKQRFTWSAIKADLVRIRPTGTCAPWQLYRADWLDYIEPPRIAGWDTNWENLTDAYITGIDLECDTFGLNKTVQLWIDQTLIQTFTVNALGRQNLALTVNSALPAPGPIRGRVFRLVATDTNPGLLYTWKFVVEKETGLQTNWNQNLTVFSNPADKFLKGLIIEADSNGANKTLAIEADGVVATTIIVAHQGRTVNQVAFPQILGRVFRIYPTDTNPSRLYDLQPIYDLEPLALTRWETQETDHQLHGWQALLWGNFTIKTLDAITGVTLTLSVYNNAGVLQGAAQVYTLAPTNLLKIKRWVSFQANKGALYKYVFTSANAFWLYREESEVFVKPWGEETPLIKRPWGNDDLDPSRGMGKASLASAHSGGEAD